MYYEKNSKQSPLRLDEIPIPLEGAGKVYITICPGKKCHSATGGFKWDRDLSADIGVMVGSGINHVVSLIDETEHERIGVPGLYDAYEGAGLRVTKVPTLDGEYPYDGIRDAGGVWDEVVCSGAKVAVHCRGGMGRAGSFVATMLVRGLGMDPEDAIDYVRKHRDGAIETNAQRIGIYQSEDWSYEEELGGGSHG